ncbi:uncharacterized protein LOC110459873 [Mizuhopecten yessoensis]|uniref:uncharacterized protein LOC110459873 n=1 Tax=Mizuhopecten yessoensis TaxID=6573 RepID=UPI000B45C264|nr:uncharacterized protein LOC110459873 [Mizuhopecten yessoensis]
MDGDEDDISREVSAIMGDHDYSDKSDVTEKCFKQEKERTSVTPDQDCSCLILFLDKDETCITVHESSNVLYVPSPTIDVEITGQSQSVRVFKVEKETSTCVRRKLTHILGEDLFTYAKEVQQRIDEYEETIKSPNSDKITMLRNTKEAVTVLLTRKVLPDRETSAAGGSTKCEITDEIDLALNGMKDSGVLAFGLFADRFVVFLDEKGNEQVQQVTYREIRKLCDERGNFNIPVDVVAVSKNFLTDTGLEQGHKVQSPAQTGSIGMVTEATKPITTETTKEADGPTTSNSEQETHKNIVVAITAGHLFTQNDDAFFVKNGETKKFGKCLTSLHRSGDTETMQYDIAVIEIDENMTTSEDCNLTFRNESGESCDCVVFDGILASGTVVYTKGAATGMSEGVVVSQDFRLAGLVDTQKAYLIEGRDDRAFSADGDSGSIVFTLDFHDEENKTANLVSIVSKMFSEDAASKLGYHVPLSYTVRLDKCLEKLTECTGVTVYMPKK